MPRLCQLFKSFDCLDLLGDRTCFRIFESFSRTFLPEAKDRSRAVLLIGTSSPDKELSAADKYALAGFTETCTCKHKAFLCA